MKLKDFQDAVLHTLSDYLGALVEQRERADKIAQMAAANPDLDLDVPDFSAAARAAMKAAGKLPALREAIEFSPRRDGVGRPVPSITACRKR